MWAPKVSRRFKQYIFNQFLTCTLAIIGVAIWVLENEHYLSTKDYSHERFSLLTWNLVVNILLIGNITLGYLHWIRFNHLIRPVLDIGITKGDEEYEKYQQKKLKLKFFSRAVLPYYLVEVGMNLISPYPWLHDTHYSDKVNGKSYQFYLNTVFLSIMIVFRTYHLVRAALQWSLFMTSRAERVTRIFAPNGNLLHKYNIYSQFAL